MSFQRDGLLQLLSIFTCLVLRIPNLETLCTTSYKWLHPLHVIRQQNLTTMVKFERFKISLQLPVNSLTNQRSYIHVQLTNAFFILQLVLTLQHKFCVKSLSSPKCMCNCACLLSVKSVRHSLKSSSRELGELARKLQCSLEKNQASKDLYLKVKIRDIGLPNVFLT